MVKIAWTRYGEDPVLTRELAVQAIQGMQGDDPRYLKVSAAPKHFTVYDGPESGQPGAPSGRMGFDAKVPEEDLDPEEEAEERDEGKAEEDEACASATVVVLVVAEEEEVDEEEEEEEEEVVVNVD